MLFYIVFLCQVTLESVAMTCETRLDILTQLFPGYELKIEYSIICQLLLLFLLKLGPW